MRDAGIEHFVPRELVKLDSPNWPFPSMCPPPERLLDNIIPTLMVADEIRRQWEDPVVCLSGWRPPAYNDFVVGGASDSQHMYFRAMDLQPANAEYDRFVTHCEDVVNSLREEGDIIGLGRYDTFIHIDTGYYGYNRNWDNRN
jgi:uncharacterized protein YcbK (DUF882 family)